MNSAHLMKRITNSGINVLLLNCSFHLIPFLICSYSELVVNVSQITLLMSAPALTMCLVVVSG